MGESQRKPGVCVFGGGGNMLFSDAGVCLCVSTGIIMMKASKTHKNKFEQGMVDEFTVEAVDIGTLKKLCIGHDNSGVK